MKKFLLTLAAALSLVALNAASVFASHYWGVRMSDPSSSSQSRTFNIDYIVLSEESSDTFTVQLFQNGSALSSQTTAKQYGDSGTFKVTVPSDGTYTYFVRATNNGESTSKDTDSQTVNVITPGEGGSSTVTSTSGGRGAGTATASSTQNGATTGTNGNSSSNGSNSGSTQNGTSLEGQVDQEGASVQNGEGVLGAEDEAKSDNDNVRNTILIILAALALFGGGYWLWRNRMNKLNQD